MLGGVVVVEETAVESLYEVGSCSFEGLSRRGRRELLIEPRQYPLS